VALLGCLLAETRDGSVLGLAERLTSSIQTCWPFITAVALRRAAPSRGQPLMLSVNVPHSEPDHHRATRRLPNASAPL